MRELHYCKTLRKKYYDRKIFNACIHFYEPGFDCAQCKRERKQPQREELVMWINNFWHSRKFPNGDTFFYKGSLKKIQKMVNIKDSNETFKKELIYYTVMFLDLIDFEIKEVQMRREIEKELKKLKSGSRLPSAKRIIQLMGKTGDWTSWDDVPTSLKETLPYHRAIDLKSALRNMDLLFTEDEPSRFNRETLCKMFEGRIEKLPNRQRLNRPLDLWIIMMAVLYEKWTGREVKRANENKQYRINKKFYDFVAYLILSMDLSKIWGSGSINKTIQKVIKNILLPLRAHLKKNPSLCLGGPENTNLFNSLFPRN